MSLCWLSQLSVGYLHPGHQLHVPPAADCAAVGIHSSDALWSSARGNSTEARLLYCGLGRSPFSETELYSPL